VSIENALITRAGTRLLSSNLHAILRLEATKGCDPTIHRAPLSLEPPYRSLDSNIRESAPLDCPEEYPAYAGMSVGLKRANLWIHPEYELNWLRAEQFIKCLASLSGRAGLEIVGNGESISLCLLADSDDFPKLEVAFGSQYELCELIEMGASDTTPFYEKSYGTSLIIADFLPSPPYSHLFTRPDELRISPLEIAILALSRIPTNTVGVIQVLFQPTHPGHDWHHNINRLLDLEYAIKLVEGLQPYQRVSSQPPSGELHEMARDMRSKAHSDKPIFVASLRIAVFSPLRDDVESLRQTSLFTNLYRHGGRALRVLGSEDYLRVLEPGDVCLMLANGYVHRHGFILNSSELTAMVHLPHVNRIERIKSLVCILDPLSSQAAESVSGTPIGICTRVGKPETVHIPDHIRMRSTHIIARHGMGKSTLMEHRS